MKFAKTAALTVALLLSTQASVFAAGEKGPFSELTGIGMGLVIIGAALGIGGLTKASLESMARQPEVANNIQTAMIISAALIEGVTFTALILMYLRWGT
ncbi:MAG TPA: ATP synthase F0 subunit C [Isosphaeraceae bacterium]|jgi:F-type H+-transporting ATPase subunit c|nr:ATP synthase F0 subunit C [Isosphaeraceae bacterium]